MKKASVIYNQHFQVSQVEPTLFGSFVEHIGRCMYGGVYDPQNCYSDQEGFRKDVKMLIKELGVKAVRYPGGNFVSGYDWKDGIGPKEERPNRKELAWGTIETNQVGIDEFIPLLKSMEIEPIIAANLGTGTPKEVGQLVEYCNVEQGTAWSNLREKNGHSYAYDIKYFCLGNEMDGEWQICMHTPEEYARLLKESAKIVKWIDPSAKVIACGSCTNEIGHKTYAEWDKIVLDEAYNYIDYVSIHRYYNYHPEKRQVYECGNNITDVPYFFSNMQDFIKTITSVCDFIKGKKHSDKVINISFDEWGLVTLSAADPGIVSQNFGFAEYSQYDAVIYGGFLCVLLNNCDRVKLACQSLLVNEGGMISTDPKGKAIRQSVYYPFMETAKYASEGYCLKMSVDTIPKLTTDHYGEQDALQMACVYHPDIEELVLFSSNLSLDEEIELNVDFSSFGVLEGIERIEIYSENMNDKNTFDNEYHVIPEIISIKNPECGKVKEILKGHSWNVFRYRVIGGE